VRGSSLDRVTNNSGILPGTGRQLHHEVSCADGDSLVMMSFYDRFHTAIYTAYCVCTCKGG